MTMTGLSGGYDGRIIILRNKNTGAGASLTLKNQDAGSSGANRFFLPGAADYILAPTEAVVLQYSSLAAWTVLDRQQVTSEWQKILKGSDESIQSSIVLQDDDALQFTAVTDGLYEIEVDAIFDGSSVADAQIDMATAGAWATDKGSWREYITINAGGGFTATGPGNLASTTKAIAAGTAGTAVGILGVGTPVHVYIKMRVYMTTGGLVKFQWCQNTSTAANTTCKAGSSMRWRRLNA
jgi:hypothetical protein